MELLQGQCLNKPFRNNLVTICCSFSLKYKTVAVLASCTTAEVSLWSCSCAAFNFQLYISWSVIMRLFMCCSQFSAVQQLKCHCEAVYVLQSIFSCTAAELSSCSCLCAAVDFQLYSRRSVIVKLFICCGWFSAWSCLCAAVDFQLYSSWGVGKKLFICCSPCSTAEVSALSCLCAAVHVQLCCGWSFISKLFLCCRQCSTTEDVE